MQDTENRICRLLFKLAVELDMVVNVPAAGMEISDDSIYSLCGRCVQNVKKTSGSITLDKAVEYQGVERDRQPVTLHAVDHIQVHPHQAGDEESRRLGVYHQSTRG